MAGSGPMMTHTEIFVDVARNLTSAATFFSPPQNRWFGKGAEIVVNTTAITGTTPTMTVEIQGIDPSTAPLNRDVNNAPIYSSTAFYSLSPQVITASVTATGLTVMSLYPGITAAANRAFSGFLPQLWVAKYVVAGTGPNITFTVSVTTVT